MFSDLTNRLLQREQQGNLRRLICTEGLIDFASNDYLGLAKSIPAQHSPFFGATGSRLLTGNSEYVERLEEEIAAFHGYEAGLIFNNGFMANLGLISAIAREGDVVFYDSHIHASTKLGLKLTTAAAFPFRHNDMDHFEQRLQKRSNKGSCYVCVESIYSTDGSMAPMQEIIELCRRYSVRLIVDEAHSVGLCGPQGRGIVYEKDLFALVVTFGKALGTMGAAVLGSHLLKETLINFSYPFIYTTALPLQQLASIRTSYNIFPHMNEERQRLQQLIATFQKRFSTRSQSAIHSIPVPGAAEAKRLSKVCHESGFDVRALTSPTVRRGEEVLRICLHAFNSEEDIIRLSEVLTCKI